MKIKNKEILMDTSIPFVDLHIQYKQIKEEIDFVINDVVQNSWFIRGPYVDKFEQMFSEKMKRKYSTIVFNNRAIFTP